MSVAGRQLTTVSADRRACVPGIEIFDVQLQRAVGLDRGHHFVLRKLSAVATSASVHGVAVTPSSRSVSVEPMTYGISNW